MKTAIQLRKRRLSDNGFSVAAVLALSTIVAVLSLAIISLVENMNNEASTAQAHADLNSAAQLAQTALTNTSTCASILCNNSGGVLVFNGSSTHVSLTNNGVNVLTENSMYSNQLQITNLLLQAGSSSSFTAPIGSSFPPAGTYTTYLATLTISGKTSHGMGLVSQSIPLILYTDGSGTLQYCGLQNSTGQICTTLSTGYNPSTGTCDLAPCDATNVTPEYDCMTPPPLAGLSCSTPIYYWAMVEGSSGFTRACKCIHYCFQ